MRLSLQWTAVCNHNVLHTEKPRFETDSQPDKCICNCIAWRTILCTVSVCFSIKLFQFHWKIFLDRLSFHLCSLYQSSFTCTLICPSVTMSGIITPFTLEINTQNDQCANSLCPVIWPQLFTTWSHIFCVSLVLNKYVTERWGLSLPAKVFCWGRE